jgi:hypothetical protein
MPSRSPKRPRPQPRWTHEEDAALRDLISGPQLGWAAVADRLGTGRTAESVRIRSRRFVSDIANEPGLASQRSTGLAAFGLPTPSGRVSRAPPSVTVGASCILFGVLSVHAHLHGDRVTTALGTVQALLSFMADYVCNAPALSAYPVHIRVVCACDRAVATSLALWLTALSMSTVSAWMCLALLPLVAVLAWSRASGSRDAWIIRVTERRTNPGLSVGPTAHPMLSHRVLRPIRSTASGMSSRRARALPSSRPPIAPTPPRLPRWLCCWVAETTMRH